MFRQIKFRASLCLLLSLALGSPVEAGSPAYADWGIGRTGASAPYLNRSCDFRSRAVSSDYDPKSFRAQQANLLLQESRERFARDQAERARLVREKNKLLDEVEKFRSNLRPMTNDKSYKAQTESFAQRRKKIEDGLKNLNGRDGTYDHIRCCQSLKAEPPFYVVGFDEKRNLNEVVSYFTEDSQNGKEMQNGFLPKGTLVRLADDRIPVKDRTEREDRLLPIQILSVPDENRMRRFLGTKYREDFMIPDTMQVKAGEHGYVYGGALEKKEVELYTYRGYTDESGFTRRARTSLIPVQSDAVFASPLDNVPSGRDVRRFGEEDEVIPPPVDALNLALSADGSAPSVTETAAPALSVPPPRLFAEPPIPKAKPTPNRMKKKKAKRKMRYGMEWAPDSDPFYILDDIRSPAASSPVATPMEILPGKRPVVFVVKDDTAFIRHNLTNSSLKDRPIRLKTENNRYVVRQCFDDSKNSKSPISEEYIFEVLNKDLRETGEEIRLNVRACSFDHWSASDKVDKNGSECFACRDVYKSLVAFDPTELRDLYRIAAAAGDVPVDSLLTMTGSGMVQIPTDDELLMTTFVDQKSGGMGAAEDREMRTHPYTRGPFGSVHYITNSIEQEGTDGLKPLLEAGKKFNYSLNDLQKILMCQRTFARARGVDERGLEPRVNVGNLSEFDRVYYQKNSQFCGSSRNEMVHQELFEKYGKHIDALNALVENNSDRFMTHDAACSFMSVLKDWNIENPNTVIQWGDGFSTLQEGHVTHHSGRCIDVRPVRPSGVTKIGATNTGYAYSRPHTEKLVQKFIDAGASIIYFNDSNLVDKYSTYMQQAGGHSDHLHVCFNAHDPTFSYRPVHPSKSDIQQRMQRSCGKLGL